MGDTAIVQVANVLVRRVGIDVAIKIAAEFRVIRGSKSFTKSANRLHAELLIRKARMERMKA